MGSKIQTALIENLSHDGRGVARIEGKTTFIQGALPGELVEFQYTKVKKNFDEGELLKVLEASSLRVEPNCPHYQDCGGCSLQHLDTDAQIRMKEAQLLDLIQRLAHTETKQVLPPLTGPYWHYRNKARLSVRYVEKKQTTLVGFRERNHPRFILDMNRCLILNERLDHDLLAIRELVNGLAEKKSIAQIEVAATEAEIALIFRHLEPLSLASQEKLKAFGQAHDYKIFLQAEGPEDLICIYPTEANPYLSYHLEDFDLCFHFHPSDFTQVNPIINQKMVKRALDCLDLKACDGVLDLYCGLGNFSLPMAKFCAKVLGVEGSKTMVNRAKHNADFNGLKNVEFFAANLDDAKAVTKVLNQDLNKLLLDPPRCGAFEIVKQMEILNPERIVYVSCNPITLARDLEILVHQKGYTLESAGVMDMFPQTTHVESIALLLKG